MPRPDYAQRSPWATAVLPAFVAAWRREGLAEVAGVLAAGSGAAVPRTEKWVRAEAPPDRAEVGDDVDCGPTCELRME